ncbi:MULTISPECIES: GhoT/OrtT family toxin [unclassified Serratia (in: enterobacteria)]|uniref:GhoT/OrtT family toxin n=1 Tax=unclassified Serratia (in: enterobacteria) TaxID=2647522 RepID=UPI000507F4CB|nr:MULTISPECIES: GhoT/OrtT family toxin [unclassified Serratia (in: enterobacteria)]KFK94447.1 membrane protein [Serratia sp. Ag2]KFK99428.1 membrane protein [Serratia sp. Ag1]
MSSLWVATQYFYLIGLLISMVFTYLVSKDSIKIRCISAVTIGLTWPLSLPVVLLFALF